MFLWSFYVIFLVVLKSLGWLCILTSFLKHIILLNTKTIYRKCGYSVYRFEQKISMVSKHWTSLCMVYAKRKCDRFALSHKLQIKSYSKSRCMVWAKTNCNAFTLLNKGDIRIKALIYTHVNLCEGRLYNLFCWFGQKFRKFRH